MHMCVMASDQLGAFLDFSAYFLDRSCHVELIDLVRLLANKLQGSACLHSTSAVFTDVHIYAWLLHGC